MDPDYFVPVGYLVGASLLFAIYAAPKVLRLVEFLGKTLERITDWWISL